MNPGADVRSIDALREWLAAFQTYRCACEESLVGIRMEIRRGQDWIEEQLSLWERAIRDCDEDLVQAKAELAARRFPDWSGRMPDATVQERNLRRAEARLEHAQDQVRRCKQWLTQLPKLIDEVYSGAAQRLGAFLEVEATRGVAQLQRQLASLEAYAEIRPDFAPAPSAASLPTGPEPRPPASGAAP
jgi:hypothetical protein